MNAFRPARIRQMEQSIIRTVTDVTDGFGGQTEVHVVHDFAIPVPVPIPRLPSRISTTRNGAKRWR